jgi:hypothetical protein
MRQGGATLRVIDVARDCPLAVASYVKMGLRNVNPNEISFPACHVSPSLHAGSKPRQPFEPYSNGGDAH